MVWEAIDQSYGGHHSVFLLTKKTKLPEKIKKMSPIEWEEKIRTLAERNGWILVAITGCTNSGKTTVAERLTKTMPGVSISQDIYFRDLDDPHLVWVELKPSGRYQNWELLCCIDWDRMCEKICEIISKPAAKSGKSFLYIDGHLVLNYSPFANLCVEKFFIELDKVTVHERRKKRTEQPDPPGYFDQYVWPLYWANRKALKGQINFINGAMSKDEIFAEFYQKLRHYLAR